MIFSLSWKNIWRSKRRSLVVIGAIIIGVWALIFMIAFYNSFGAAFSKNAINYEYSHIQIHNPDYLIEPDIFNQIDDEEQIISLLNENPSVISYSGRRKVNGMIASSKTSIGVQIYGVDTRAESETTRLEEQLIDGTYFNKIKRNPVLISAKVADKLRVKVRSKIVITFQDMEGNITSASCRIEGIFDSKSPKINEGVIYLRKSDLNRLVGADGINEFAILLNNSEQIDEMKSTLTSVTANTVRSYKEVAPEFNLMEESSVVTKQLLTVVIMLALLFGIVNTMLMAVLERTKEIGMLRSVGMKKRSVFSMIMIETSLMGLLAGPIGLTFGYLTILWLGSTGLDLSAYSDALKEYGFDSVFYPQIKNSTYPILMSVVMFTAFSGAIYPAIKAIRLNPLEAIRKL
ncbi:MAG: ABC transporter permease [Cytophagales bacterium]|nr:ABC transporter permease [Cytophagales bacterium]